MVVWLVSSEPKLVAFGMKRRFLDSNTLEEQQEQKKKKRRQHMERFAVKHNIGVFTLFYFF